MGRSFGEARFHQEHHVGTACQWWPRAGLPVERVCERHRHPRPAAAGGGGLAGGKNQLAEYRKRPARAFSGSRRDAERREGTSANTGGNGTAAGRWGGGGSASAGGDVARGPDGASRI